MHSFIVQEMGRSHNRTDIDHPFNSSNQSGLFPLQPKVHWNNTFMGSYIANTAKQFQIQFHHVPQSNVTYWICRILDHGQVFMDCFIHFLWHRMETMNCELNI